MERVILMAKAPIAGRVKTRLVPSLDARQAAALYRALLADSLRLLVSLATPDRKLELCRDGDWAPPRTDGGRRIELTRQCAGDLGERLAAAFERSHAAGARRTVALGADAPTLPPERVEQAFATLADGSDVVLIPSHDGGYVALGLAGPPRRELFSGIRWGGAEVAAETERRARAADLRTIRLDGWYDVDDTAALCRLERELRDPAAARRAPQTARWLARETRDGWTPSEPP